MKEDAEADSGIEEDEEEIEYAEENAENEEKLEKKSKKAARERTESEFLVSRQKYLASGIHIGMKQHTKQMRPFIYKIRPDGLAVMNLHLIDQRIQAAAKFLAKADKILIISRRAIAHKAIEKFEELIGAKAIQGRFMPGTLTNPNYSEFYEADVIFVIDPMSDYQAIHGAVTARVPIIAICDTFNETRNIDLVIPANNKGAKSVAMIFWLLTREILKERGKIKSNEEYKHKVEDFMKEFERRPRESSGGRDRRRGRGTRGSGSGRESRGGRRRDSRGRPSRNRGKRK